MIDDNPASHGEDAPPPRPGHGRALLLGAAGSAVLVLIVVFVWALSQRDILPELTEERLSLAEELWKKHGPADYNLDVQIEGRRAGQVHVEVRHGEVTAMTRDGHQPSQQRTWYPWSVPGQFDTMSQELEIARHPGDRFQPTGGQPTGGAQVILRARFDARYGYPLSFNRIVLGSDDEIRWKTVKFEVLADKK